MFSNGSGGSASFTDMLGNQFASYTSGQLTGGTIQITSSGIVVSNAANQILNSTQEINLGSGLSGALDDVWSYSTQGITRVTVGGNLPDALLLKDDGTGLALPGNNTVEYYHNGILTPLSGVPVPTSSGGVFIDNNNEIIVGTSIYSGAQANFAGGRTTALLGQDGKPISVLALSSSGNYILGYGATSGTFKLYSRVNGTITSTTTINISAYTNPDGSVANFVPTGINDNGLIVGVYNDNGLSPNPIVSAIYNTQNSTISLLQDPNAGSLPDVGGGTIAYAINNQAKL